MDIVDKYIGESTVKIKKELAKLKREVIKAIKDDRLEDASILLHSAMEEKEKLFKEVS